MTLAGTKVLPSIFNALITISVISVANSATYASTRTIQALAVQGMAPKFLAYVDKKGRPVPTVILQLLFGCLAFINEASATGSVIFGWLLALSGLANYFIWGSICLCHIRFRRAWKLQGHSTDEIPFKAQFGLIGSYCGLALCWICMIAQFYVALFPIGGSPNAEAFFESFLAAPLILALYFIWKAYSWFAHPTSRPLFIRARDIDIYTGLRQDQKDLSDPRLPEEQRKQSIISLQESKKKTFLDYPKSVITALF